MTSKAALYEQTTLYGGDCKVRYLKEWGVKSRCTSPDMWKSVEPHAKRLEGFLQVYPQAVVISTAIGSPASIASIQDQVEQLLAVRSIDALAAVNDLTLFDLLMRCPMDLPAVGYDASPFSSLLGKRVARGTFNAAGSTKRLQRSCFPCWQESKKQVPPSCRGWLGMFSECEQQQQLLP
jgi:hypothetical protein